MRRKIYDSMREWKTGSNGRTALLIDGARRVGKSYVAEEFGRNEYESYIVVDFNKEGEEIRGIFDYLNDLDTFFMYLSTYFNVVLHERRSLIIFDEVEMFPRARAAIKYLVADGRYDYIETGSLMSIRKNVKDIVIPSEERHINMYPMDFEEFLWAVDNMTLMPFIRNCFNSRKPMGSALHRKAMNLFRLYMCVGGMPQAVSEYVSSKNYSQVDAIKRDILNLYRADIVKHAEGCELKVQNLFDEIPSQLQKHERRFRLSALGKNARMRDYEDAIFWLSDAMMVNIAYNTTAPSVGLKMNRDRVTMKCYMADTGLLISHAFDENEIVQEEIYSKLIFNKLEVNMGMIMENLVAQMLRSSGHKLYFYSRSSAECKEDRMEIDFLVSKHKVTSRHNIVPIEVKSSTYYTLSSLKKYISKFENETCEPVVLHTNDLEVKDGITYLPIYMAGLL